MLRDRVCGPYTTRKIVCQAHLTNNLEGGIRPISMTLVDWMAQTGTRVAVLAGALHVSRQTVYGWMRGAVPTIAHATAIERHTAGAVTIQSFVRVPHARKRGA